MYKAYDQYQNGTSAGVDEESALATLQRSRSEFQAYPADERSSKKPIGTTQQMFIATLVFCDIILVGIQPILVQFSKTGNRFGYNPVCVNLLIEMSKATFMFCMIFLKGLSKPKYGEFSLRALYKMLVKNHMLVIPAVLYAINNYLKFIMQLSQSFFEIYSIIFLFRNTNISTRIQTPSLFFDFFYRSNLA